MREQGVVVVIGGEGVGMGIGVVALSRYSKNEHEKTHFCSHFYY
jgi:hypothetical protein